MTVPRTVQPRVLHLIAALVLVVSVAPLPAQPHSDFEQARMLRVWSLLQPTANSAPAAKSLGLAASDGAITGTVRGLDPEAQASAWVMAWPAQDEAGRGEAEGRPDVAMRVPLGKDGQYRLEGLEAGPYYVSAMAKEYETRYYDDAANLEAATAVEVPENGTVEGIDFTLVRYGTGEGSIEGRVVADLDGTPIAGATIHAFSPDNPYSYGVAETDKDGRYAITSLRTGGYVVEVVHPDYLPEFFGDATTYDQAVLVEVVEPDPTRGVDFGLRKGGSISGVVRDAQGLPVAGAYIHGNATFDRGSQPTPDAPPSAGPAAEDTATEAPATGAPATVAIEPGVESSYYGGWAVTDASGAYRMGGLVTGDYRVQAQSSTGWVYAAVWYDGAQTYDQAKPVAVVTGEETAGIDMTLDLPVMDSALAGRVTDGSGHPVAGAFVVLQEDMDWILRAEPGGTETSAAVPVEVATRVWAHATTDEDGRYLIEQLPAGSYVVSAATEGGWEYVQRWHGGADNAADATVVDLAEGERRTDIDVILPLRVATAGISGTIRDQNGEAIAAFIEIRPVERQDDGPGAPGLWAYGHADEEGNYRVDRLPAGTYTVHASYSWGRLYGHAWYGGGESPETATFVVLADGETHTDIDFQLDVRPIYGTVAGVVTDAVSGQALTRAYVVLSPLAARGARSTPMLYWNPWVVTDKAGAFELDWIPEGRYSITVYADGAAAPTVDFEVQGGETARHDVALRRRQDGDATIAGVVTTGYGNVDYIAAGQAGAPDALPETIRAMPALPAISVVMAFPLGRTQVTAGPAQPYIAVSRQDGSYELQGLPAGDYILMCLAPGHTGTYYGDTYAPDKAEKVHVDAGGRQQGIDFRLSYMPIYLAAAESGIDADAAPARVTAGGSASVYGRVADDGGQPVANATLYLLDADERPVASVQTGTDGSFELASVTPGAYRVYAGKPGYAGAYNGNKRRFASAEALQLADGQLEVNLVLSTQVITAVGEEAGSAVPRDMVLDQNFPNPFNPETKISFTVQVSGPTTLRVYDALGQQVAVPFNRVAEAGTRYDVVFRASGLGAGIYYYTLTSAGQRVSRPMVLVK